MSKTRILAIIAVAILLTAIVTNPKEEKHQQEISTVAKTILEKQLGYENKDAIQLGMTLFGDRIINNFMNTNVSVKNYYLFSLTTLHWEAERHTIGIGAFGKVWITDAFEKESTKIMQTLKKL